MEENSKKEILNNLEKLHDMVEDNDPNNQDQAVSEIMEEKVSDLYNELQENKFDIEAANMSMIDKAEVESKLDTTFVNEIVQIVTNEDETITGDLFLLCHKNNCGFSTEFKNFKANLLSSRSEKTLIFVLIKFIHSEKAKMFHKIFDLSLILLSNVKTKLKIFQTLWPSPNRYLIVASRSIKFN